MKDIYLEITFRKGKSLAAYIYLSRKTGTHVINSVKYKEGIIVDFDEANNAIGLEITAPHMTSFNEINEILDQLKIAPISEQELAPLKAA
jgi:uncharacterized protein YuzE